MAEHELKCWPEFFNRILTGEKTFEARKDDRNFRGGDTLRIREWRPEGKVYTGREVTVEVTYLLAGPLFGVQPGWAVMGFTPPAIAAAQQEARAERDRALRALANEFDESAQERADSAKHARGRDEAVDAAFHEAGRDVLKYAAFRIRALLEGK